MHFAISYFHLLYKIHLNDVLRVFVPIPPLGGKILKIRICQTES